MSEDTKIESESNVNAGPFYNILGYDAYDLVLIRKASGGYALQLSMRLQFRFVNYNGKTWNITEKQAYIKSWEYSVRNVWDNQMLRILDDGSAVMLNLDFIFNIDGRMDDPHWEIYVTKQQTYPTDSNAKSFYPETKRSGDVYLAIDNIQARFKKLCPNLQYKQTLSAHEFGHMLGLTEDEYKGNECQPTFSFLASDHNKDYGSIMNIGQQIRDRHKLFILGWLNDVLKDNGIK